MNQSLLKTLIKGPHAFIAAQSTSEKELYYEEKTYFIIGSAVDCYLTQGKEEFDKTYYISDSNSKPKSEKIMSIVKDAFDKFAEELITKETLKEIPTTSDVIFLLTSDRWNQLVWEACNTAEFYNNRKKAMWQEDGRLDTVRKDKMLEYVCDLFKSLGKQILTDEQSILVGGIIMSLTTNPKVAHFFTDECEDDIDLYFQLPVYFDYINTEDINGKDTKSNFPNEDIVVSAKILCDLVIVNHTRETIQPVDIKTTMYELYNFLYAVRDRRYDIQAAFYTYAINKWKEQIKLNTIEDKKEYSINYYKILPFVFVAESNNPAIIGNPLPFICSDKLLRMGWEGRPEAYHLLTLQQEIQGDIDNKVVYGEIKGVKQLFEDYNYYSQNGFNKRKEIVNVNGFIMDWSKTYPINNNVNN